MPPSCALYAKLLFNGVCERLGIREETSASGQADKQFNKTAEEDKFHPQLESHVVTWVTNILPSYVVTRAHNRKSEPSARIYLTEYYFSLFPQRGEQARRLGYFARNPTTVSASPTDVSVTLKLENIYPEIKRTDPLDSYSGRHLLQA